MMFSYEMSQARHADLQREAENWRLARDARAAAESARRARPGQARNAATVARGSVRTDAEAAEGASPGVPDAARLPLGRAARRAPRPHRAV